MFRASAMIVLILLSGCAKPTDGPSARSIMNATSAGGGGKIPIIPLENAPQSLMSGQSTAVATGPGMEVLGRAQYSSDRLQRGDVFDVTVFDTGEDGLFSSADSKTLNLGRFTVDNSGSVTMPFIGRQRVMGNSVDALQARIAEGLKGSAVNPQVVVNVVERPNASVNVSGAVKTPGKASLTASQERILDVINENGGPIGSPDTTQVTLVRGSQRATTTLSRVMSDNAQNVLLLPGDELMLSADQTTFTALGAFKGAGEIPFEPGKLSLAQAVGRAGGLSDDRADARNVYIFREEFVQVVDKNVRGPNGPVVQPAAKRPVIYRVNMRDAASIILMQSFQMKAGDVLYATTAPLVDSAKLLTVFQKSAPTPPAPAPLPLR